MTLNLGGTIDEGTHVSLEDFIHQSLDKLICIKDIHKVWKTRHQNLVFGHHKRVRF
jgi:hypothetical protein